MKSVAKKPGAGSAGQAPAEPQLSLMERRRQSAMQEIADVALELFARDGFEATTVEAIAARAGCSPRTFYRYFGSKEDVMFHDLPIEIAAMGRVLDAHLAEGMSEWAAVCTSLVSFIGRFDAGHIRTATRRMELWSNEPALRARYQQYIALAEQTVLDSLCRHRGTRREHDDLAQLIAVATVGAYRTTVSTHDRADRRLGEHLQESLDRLGAGLNPDAR
ncbi:MAG TPA: TetR family transcriptional regulator [Pseudonocardia sp.]|nr:TetR family transcriptional regulator [Pseudonocardia sp.]